MLGDVIERALSAIGVTADRVERWIGMPCGCPERRERLNQLSAWATRVVMGKTKDASRYLDQLVNGER